LLGSDPWFSSWNYDALRLLFGAVPHSRSIDAVFDFLIFNHLVTTWIFVACFYVLWATQDSQQGWRRRRLLQIPIPLCVAVLISLIVRPWVSWPPPVLNPAFRSLYPSYFWSNSNQDSFPSHATLVYFVVATGIWPLKKWLSVVLALLVLLLIALPRIYVGGHYPIDVFASLLLVFLVLPLVWRFPVPEPVSKWLITQERGRIARELLLILWLFELGESFGSVTSILRRFWHFG
jgi:membrane-associated phospholipid phosphatase